MCRRNHCCAEWWERLCGWNNPATARASPGRPNAIAASASERRMVTTVVRQHLGRLRGQGPSPEHLWDMHGTSLYSLACTVLGDEQEALRAVSFEMVDLYSPSDAQSAIADDASLRAAARCVYERCRAILAEPSSQRTMLGPPLMIWLGDLARRQRDALALCVFGGTTTDRPPQCLVWHRTSGPACSPRRCKNSAVMPPPGEPEEAEGRAAECAPARWRAREAVGPARRRKFSSAQTTRIRRVVASGPIRVPGGCEPPVDRQQTNSFTQGSVFRCVPPFPIPSV